MHRPGLTRNGPVGAAPGFSYSIADHGRSLSELVDHLGLDDFVVMGQDWGGPTGLSMAVNRADRVRGLVLGSTWFWQEEGLLFKLWSTSTARPPLSTLLRRTDFWMRVALRRLTVRTLSATELDHYLRVQPPGLRIAASTEFPRQVTGAGATLAQLERDVVERLAHKRTLIIKAERDPAFRVRQRERLARYFDDKVVLELPDASHYFQHDAPEAVAEAIRRTFL